MRDLATSETRTRVASAVGEIEKSTSAEIVVMLRATSGDYHAADFIFGAVCALLVLCVFLYSPREFDFTYFPLEQIGGFALGALCARICRRSGASSPRERSKGRTSSARRAIFVDRRLTRTRARTGVLVYLSAFEEAAEVVLDLGLDRKKLGAPYEAACERLHQASARGNRDELLAGLTDLGAALAKVYPAGDDDTDELPNEVAA